LKEWAGRWDRARPTGDRDTGEAAVLSPRSGRGR
jgi:hypothetical protein